MSGIDPVAIISLGGASAIASSVTVAVTLLRERRKRKNSEDDENRNADIEVTVTDKEGSATYNIDADDEVSRKILEAALEEISARNESESIDSAEQQDEHEEAEENIN